MNTPSFWKLQIIKTNNLIKYLILTISPKHSMAQWTSFLLRCLSQAAKTGYRGITSRKRSGDDILAMEGNVFWLLRGAELYFVQFRPDLIVVNIAHVHLTHQCISTRPNGNAYLRIIFPSSFVWFGLVLSLVRYKMDAVIVTDPSSIQL